MLLLLRHAEGWIPRSDQVEALARIAIGIELLPHRATIVALNLYGKVIAREKIFLDFEPTDDYFISLKDAVQNFMNTNHYEEEKVLMVRS